MNQGYVSKVPVALVRGDSRYTNVRDALELIADQVSLADKRRILIKVNFVSARRQLAATHVDAVRAVTGWNVSLWELMKVGERRLNLLRAFNAREGVGAEVDTVPPKLSVPLMGGKSDGVLVTAEEVEAAKALYYRMAGWDEDGHPTRAKLEELALGWVANELGI